jgi:hypothetical protein
MLLHAFRLQRSVGKEGPQRAALVELGTQLAEALEAAHLRGNQDLAFRVGTGVGYRPLGGNLWLLHASPRSQQHLLRASKRRSMRV